MRTSTGLLIILAIALMTAASLPSSMRLVRWQSSNETINPATWSVASWELPEWAVRRPAPVALQWSPLWMLEGGKWSTR